MLEETKNAEIAIEECFCKTQSMHSGLKLNCGDCRLSFPVIVLGVGKSQKIRDIRVRFAGHNSRSKECIPKLVHFAILEITELGMPALNGMQMSQNFMTLFQNFPQNQQKKIFKCQIWVDEAQETLFE